MVATERVSLPEQHYLYVERSCAMEGPDIAAAMGEGFGRVFGFIQEEGIRPLSMPSALYLAMPEGGKMTFRAATFVSPEDSARARGDIVAGTIPAGEAMKAVHVGPYAHLNQTHQALWARMQEDGLDPAMPVWEIYVDDPTSTPEDTLRTEIYRRIG